MKQDEILVMDETYSGLCVNCHQETRWFNMRLQDHQCCACFDKWWEKVKNYYKKKEEEKMVEPFKEINIYHADDIYKAKRGQALWYIKELWVKYVAKWYKYQEEKFEKNWQGMIQCRHYVIACTRILKDRGAWDDKACCPMDDLEEKAL